MRIVQPAVLFLLGSFLVIGGGTLPAAELTGGVTRVGGCGGWPSFVNLRDGRVLAVRGNEARASADAGLTWSRPEPLLRQPEVRQRGGITSIIRLASGQLGAVLLRVGGIPNKGHDADNYRTMALHFTTSADEGVTWSEPVRMNRHGMWGGPHVATLIQTRAGRLILPVRAGFAASAKLRADAGAYGLVDGERRQVGGHTTYPEIDIAFCYLSDDEGRSWRKSSGFIFGWFQDRGLGAFACDEPVVIELRDKRIMMLARTTIGQLYRVLSSDGGENWDVPEPAGLTAAYAPCMVRRIPTTGDLVLIWNQVSRQEIETGYERCRLSVAVSKDDGQTWTHAKTLFRSHLPDVGLIPAEPVTGHIGIAPFVGELPKDYATADYPNIHFHEDKVWFHYDRNPKFLGGAYWTLRIFPIQALYE